MEFITIFKATHEHTGSRSILSLVCRGIGLTLPITQLEKQISLRSAMLSSCLWGHTEDGPSHSEEEVSSRGWCSSDLAQRLLRLWTLMTWNSPAPTIVPQTQPLVTENHIHPWVTSCLQSGHPSTCCGYYQASAMTHGTSSGKTFSPCHMGAGITRILRTPHTTHRAPHFLKLPVSLAVFHTGTHVPAPPR